MLAIAAELSRCHPILSPHTQKRDRNHFSINQNRRSLPSPSSLTSVRICTVCNSRVIDRENHRKILCTPQKERQAISTLTEDNAGTRGEPAGRSASEVGNLKISPTAAEL
jgi:hypothetical protein